MVPSPVLVDDPGHELDLTARVRAVFDVVFGDRADVWWSDVGAALDSRNGVEGWLRRGFFDYHLKTHSKSRRKAPILWPIGTRSGSYRVWLYAHQVTKDTDVDAYLKDATARFDWKAYKEAKASAFKIRVGQQKQKKAK